MKKSIIKKTKKAFNKLKLIPKSNARSIKMNMDIAEEYLFKVYYPTGNNTVGGMLRVSTLHLKQAEYELNHLEKLGFNVDKYKGTAVLIRESYNTSRMRYFLSLENSHYEEELINEGFLHKL